MVYDLDPRTVTLLQGFVQQYLAHLDLLGGQPDQSHQHDYTYIGNRDYAMLLAALAQAGVCPVTGLGSCIGPVELAPSQQIGAWMEQAEDQINALYRSIPRA